MSRKLASIRKIDNMFIIDLSKENITGRQYADLLEENGITANKNGVPGELRSFAETSGVRIGVAAETTRGHKQDWFINLAHRMVTILKEGSSNS